MDPSQQTTSAAFSATAGGEYPVMSLSSDEHYAPGGYPGGGNVDITDYEDPGDATRLLLAEDADADGALTTLSFTTELQSNSEIIGPVADATAKAADGDNDVVDMRSDAAGDASGDNGRAAGSTAFLNTAVLSADVTVLLEQMAAAPSQDEREADQQGSDRGAHPDAEPQSPERQPVAEPGSDPGPGDSPGGPYASERGGDVGALARHSPEEAAAAASRALQLIAAAANRLTEAPAAVSVTDQPDAAEPVRTAADVPVPAASAADSGSASGAAAVAAAAARVSGCGPARSGDPDVAEGCRLLAAACRRGPLGTATAWQQALECAALLMRIGASGLAADADRAMAFSAVAELCSAGHREGGSGGSGTGGGGGTEGVRGAEGAVDGGDLSGNGNDTATAGTRRGDSSAGVRAVADAATAVPGGPQALVECLSHWATDPSGACLPYASAALRAAVALSASAAPLVALLRARLLTGLATILARGVLAPASASPSLPASAGSNADTESSTAGMGATAALPLLRGCAAFLAMLSAHAALGRHMMSAGIHVLACRLLSARSRASLAVMQSCCDIVSNLALGAGLGGGTAGDRAAQAALTTAGAGPGLVRMLALRNVQALCHAADAIANLTLGSFTPAQAALSGAIGPLSGVLVTSVGPTGQPLLLAVKTARALGNACQGHWANQEAAVKAGVYPVLVAWMRSGVPPLVRSATAAAANITVGNRNAAAAAVAAGILQPLTLLLMQRTTSLASTPTSTATRSRASTPPVAGPAALTGPSTLVAAEGAAAPVTGAEAPAHSEGYLEPPPAGTAETAVQQCSAPEEGRANEATPAVPASCASPAPKQNPAHAVEPFSAPPKPQPQHQPPLPPASTDLFERAAVLLSGLSGCCPELRAELARQSSLARLLTARLAAGGLTPGATMAVCGALNNLLAGAPSGAAAMGPFGAPPSAPSPSPSPATSSSPPESGPSALEAARAGAVGPLLRLVMTEQRHEGVLRRSCHCLATVVMGNKPLQDALMAPPPPPPPRKPTSPAPAVQRPQPVTPPSTSSVSTSAAAGAGDGPDTQEDGTDGADVSAGGGAAERGAASRDSAAVEREVGGSSGEANNNRPAEGSFPSWEAAGTVGGGGGARTDLPARLAQLLATAGGAARSFALAAEVARLCGALCFRSNSLAQQRLADAGVLEGLVALLRVNHVPTVCQGLMAAANLAGGCPGNARRLVRAGVGPELQRLLRVRGDEVVARAAYCAAVLADQPGEPDTAAAAPGSNGTSNGAPNGTSASNGASPSARGKGQQNNGGRSGGEAEVEVSPEAGQEAASAGSAPGPQAGSEGPGMEVSEQSGAGSEQPVAGPAEAEDVRTALAAVGLVPPLVRCLRHPNRDVAARGIAALEALVRGHRANALLVVAAGGIAHLAALMERPAATTPTTTNPAKTTVTTTVATRTDAAAAAAPAAAPRATPGPGKGKHGKDAGGPTSSVSGKAPHASLAARTGPKATAGATAPKAERGAVGNSGAAAGGGPSGPHAGGPPASGSTPAAQLASGQSAAAGAGPVSEAQQTALWRRCVDLWGSLGGLPALVRLLSHRAPAVVERAASLIRSIAEGSDTQAQSRLRRSGAAASLLRACRHRNTAVAESSLRAVEALARCAPPLPQQEQQQPKSLSPSPSSAASAGARNVGGGGDGGGGGVADSSISLRAQLVDAGALGVLQSLQSHPRAAIARLASQVAHSLYVKPGAT